MDVHVIVRSLKYFNNRNSKLSCSNDMESHLSPCVRGETLSPKRESMRLLMGSLRHFYHKEPYAHGHPVEQGLIATHVRVQTSSPTSRAWMDERNVT